MTNIQTSAAADADLINLFKDYSDAEYSAVLAFHKCQKLHDPENKCWIGLGYVNGPELTQIIYLEGEFGLKQWYDDYFEYVRIPKTLKSIKATHTHLINLGELMKQIEAKNPNTTFTQIYEKYKNA